MENYLYTCGYCGKQYKPNRRKIQKYCSNSCRTRAFQLRNQKKISGLIPENSKNEPLRINKMSIAGIGNAAAGVAIVKIAENIFTNDENKPATKKDINELKEQLTNRYKPINNVPSNAIGKPYYDEETKKIIFKKN